MKKLKIPLTTQELLARFANMSGTEKIRIGLELSETVREVRRNGAKSTRTTYGLHAT